MRAEQKMELTSAILHLKLNQYLEEMVTEKTSQFKDIQEENRKIV